jgi:phenylacetate-coenzyme A ligase PaaK-like adenylate-forming protein
MPIWEDAYLVEVLNPTTLEPMADGEEGGLALVEPDALPKTDGKAVRVLDHRRKD